jgi:adenosylhomocysteine nucleosidase
VNDVGAPTPASRDSSANAHEAARARSGILGAVVALPAEARCLTHSSPPLLRPLRLSSAMFVCRGGVGDLAAERACLLLLAAGATALVSWGVAAGLDPKLAPGTLVVSGQLANDLDPSLAPIANIWAERLIDRVRASMAVSPGPIASTGQVLATAAAKRDLARTGAVAADMETGAVARIARKAKVPWIAVRAIADGADTAVPTGILSALDSTGRVLPGRFVGALARHPGELLELPALARGFRAALRALRLAARLAAPTLEAPLAASGSSTGAGAWT